jgi:sec-independent protein translocase protein TatA
MPVSIGPGELIIVLVIALIVLGPKRLPEVGRSVGKGMREFKDSLSGMNPLDDDDDDDDAERKPLRQPAGSTKS